MSAQMRVMPTNEADQGFGLLKDIVDMVKNPDAIDEAYKRRQDAAKLSDEEVAKAEAARALIARADSLAASLSTREDALVADRTEHITTVKEFSEKVQAETTCLNEREAALNAIAESQATAVNALKNDRDSLNADIAKFDNDAQSKNDALNARENAIKDKEQSQKEEDDRLSVWADRLKAKAGRLMAEAQSDG